MSNPGNASIQSSLPRRAGTAFNPYRKVCGFYPPDWVRRDPKLSSGAKLTYERLVRFGGKNGICHPSQKTLAIELGISERQVRRNLQELEAGGLISWRRGGRSANGDRLCSRYSFLWHAMFDRALSSCPPASSTGHAQHVRADIAGLSIGHLSPGNSVQGISAHEVQSSSAALCCVANLDRRTDERGMNPTNHWQTEAEVEHAQQRLAEVLAVKQERPGFDSLPSRSLVRNVLSGLDGRADLDDYLSDVLSRPECRPRTAAYFAGKLLTEWNQERRKDFRAARSRRNAARLVAERAENERMEAERRREAQYTLARAAIEQRRKETFTWSGQQIATEIDRLKNVSGHEDGITDPASEITRLCLLPAYLELQRLPTPRKTTEREDLEKELAFQQNQAQTWPNPLMRQYCLAEAMKIQAKLAAAHERERGAKLPTRTPLPMSSTAGSARS